MKTCEWRNVSGLVPFYGFYFMVVVLVQFKDICRQTYYSSHACVLYCTHKYKQPTNCKGKKFQSWVMGTNWWYRLVTVRIRSQESAAFGRVALTEAQCFRGLPHVIWTRWSWLSWQCFSFPPESNEIKSLFKLCGTEQELLVKCLVTAFR